MKKNNFNPDFNDGLNVSDERMPPALFPSQIRFSGSRSLPVNTAWNASTIQTALSMASLNIN